MVCQRVTIWKGSRLSSSVRAVTHGSLSCEINGLGISINVHVLDVHS